MPITWLAPEGFQTIRAGRNDRANGEGRPLDRAAQIGNYLKLTAAR